MQKFGVWSKKLKQSKKQILFSVVFFIIAGITFYFIGNYADERPGASQLPDLFLDLIPPMQWAGYLFVIGIFFYILALIFYPLIFEVDLFAKTIFQLSLMIMIRNAFLPLTGIAGRADAVAVTFPFFANHWNFHNDLFFSGHAVVPLLGFFIFKNKKAKYFFLAGAILMGLSALITHLHYSIDVFAGLFIGYGSYKIGEWIFAKINKKVKV